MKKTRIIFSLVIFAGLILSACQPGVEPGEPTDGEYEYGQNATVDSLEVVLLESFPLQAQALISGTLPDGCTELHEVSVEQQGLRFNITLTTRRPTGDIACTEALVPFEETVDLDIRGLEAGTYTVIAQDQQATFTLDVENALPSQDEDIKFSFGSTATIESLNVQIMESFPVQVSVVLTGYLPDGCTEIYEINASREDQTFTIQVLTRRPVDLACTMAIVPFEETVSLNVEGLPAGDYTVELGDLSQVFTLEQDNE
jgi:inhibitor of cysteine peptidase